jgi:polygalacturonase
MRTAPALIFFALLACAHGAEFSAARYGAKGDGKTVDRVAIQKAIDAAAAGHGTVVFAPGVYLSGSLFLKSGMNFRVDEGVEIHGVQDQGRAGPGRDPVMPTRVAGIEMKWPAALINVYEQSGVTISGKATATEQGDGEGFTTRDGVAVGLRRKR